MKTQALLLSLLFAATANAKPAATPATTTTTTTTTTAAAPATTPAETCNKLVEAAKADDFAAASAISTWPAGKGGKQAKGKFGKMHNDYLSKIKGITCGTAYVADETAVVEAQAEGKKRFVPFVNEAGTWKFNVEAYKAMYKVPHGAEHGKKAM